MDMPALKYTAQPLQNYVRTPEDDEQDRRELEWKTRANRQVLEKFLRTNPSGRVVPRDD